MARFFIAASNIFGGMAYIDKKEAEHIKVLRIRDGETFTICDGNGNDYICRLVHGEDGGELAAEIIEKVPSGGEPNIHCCVYAAYPKRDKAELIIQKSVEVGVTEIVFFPSARCISRPDDKSVMKKTERWQKIAAEAAKQSGRGRIPKVRTLPSFKEAVSEAAGASLPLFLYECENKLSLRDAVTAGISAKTVSVMTGPEGGFEESEASAAVSLGMKSVTLGPRILRCETAPVIAAAAVMLLTGNLE